MKIAIIGGGLAGICAAHTLLAERTKVSAVHLFEAAGRYGGRAYTDTTSIPGFAFDKGPLYIQDPSINPLTEIARQLGFKTIEENAEYRLRVNKDGQWKDEPVTTTDVQNVVDEIEASYKRACQHANVVVTRKPRMDTYAEMFGHATSTYGPFTESAETWQYIAADRAREGEGDGKNNLFVEQGIGNLVSAYGRKLKELYSERYFEHLSTAVSDITYHDHRVDIGYNRTSLTVDACIVTVPVSVLGNGSIRFVPPLPDSHRQALKVLRLGSYKKIALRLRAAPDGIRPGTNYYMVHEGEPEGVWQYYCLPHAPDVLVAHAAGDFAAALDAMPDSDVYNLFKNDIQQAYEGVFFTTGKTMTNWSNAAGVLGAYSYSAFNGGGPNDRHALEARVALGKSVKCVHFAGEATNVEYYGTLQAACFEGRRAAKDILTGA